MPSRTRPWTTLLLAVLLSACSGSPAPTPAIPALSSQTRDVVGRVDAALSAAWSAEGVTVAPAADDLTFLRRASLDLVGALPEPAQIQAFAADTSPDKRARLVDALLADPRFSDRFAAEWTSLLLGDEAPKNGVDRAAFTAWLRARMVERAPWDAIVRGVIADEGQNSPGGSVRERSVASQAPAAEQEDPDVHGSVNYLIRYRGAVEDLTGRTSRAFLGIQIQCAQCHDHKTEAWTRDQFRGLAAAFVQTRAVPVEGRKRGEMTVLDVRDVPRARLGPKATDAQRAIAATPPRALDGTSLEGPSRRKLLAAWITAKDNPTFARAFVNRAWDTLLGSGLVEPVDDLRPGNPPKVPAVLDALAEDFTRGGFDVRRLYAAICATQAYQRAAGAPARLWASYTPRPLDPEVLFDAVLTASGLAPLLEETLGERADALRARVRHGFAVALDVDEDADPERFQGSVRHALVLSNGVVTRLAATALPGSPFEKLLHGPGSDDDKLTALYLRTLSRPPSAEERAGWVRFLDEAAQGPFEPPATPVAAPKREALGRFERRRQSAARTAREQAYEDLAWALFNASEMGMQH